MPDIPILENDRRQQYTATVGQTQFPYDFPIFGTADLDVYRTRGAVTTLLAFSTDYTLTGIGAAGGGNVVLNAGAVVGDIITVNGSMAVERTSDYQESGDLRSAVLNADFDRIIIMIQELRSAVENTVQLPPTTPPGIDLVIPPPAPLKYWRWSASNEIEFVDLPAGGGGGPALTVPIPRDQGGTGSASGWQIGVITTTPYTVTPTDDKRTLVFNRPGGVAVNLPATDLVPAGFSFDFYNLGGLVTFTPNGLNTVYPGLASLAAPPGARRAFNHGGGAAASGVWYGSRTQLPPAAIPDAQGGRLTLVRGVPLPSASIRALTPSATDTTGDTVTFPTAHNFVTGMGVCASANGGGLLAGNRVFARVNSPTQIQFHPSRADADGNLNRVDLTAAISASIGPCEIFLERFAGKQITLWTGATWETIAIQSDTALNLAAVPADKNGDVFAYKDANGAPLLELVQWSADTVRATALALQDGIEVKAGDPTRLYLGTFRTTGVIGQTEDSGEVDQRPARRFLWNRYNRQARSVRSIHSGAVSYTYGSTTWRRPNANGINATMGLQLVRGLDLEPVNLNVTHLCFTDSSEACQVSIDLNGALAPAGAANIVGVQIAGGGYALGPAHYAGYPGIGFHHFYPLERSMTGTINFYLYGKVDGSSVGEGAVFGSVQA
jgi:hypothetical protein